MKDFLNVVDEFCTLRPTLSSSVMNRIMDGETMSPKELEMHLRQVDERLLIHCITRLITGNIGTLCDPETALPMIEAAGTTIEIILRAAMPNINGNSVWCLSNLMNHSSDHQKLDYFSKFRITTRSKAAIMVDSKAF